MWKLSRKPGARIRSCAGRSRPGPAGESTREPLTVHWMVVGAGDEVVAAGAAREVQGGRLIVDLGRRA